MTKLRRIPIALALAMLPQSVAQPLSTDRPAFEVASVKPCTLSKKGDGPTPSGVTVSGNRVTAVIPLRSLIMFAYTVKNYQLEPGKDWIEGQASDAYCLSARTEGESSPTIDQVRQTLQTLLAERFELRLHRETKNIPVYALVVDKNGPKLKTSVHVTEPARAVRSRVPTGFQLTTTNGTMPWFAAPISSLTDRPVLDKTGLSGSYDHTLAWSPTESSLAASDSGGTSIYTAVREQLGLRFEPQHASLEILVLEHAKIVPSEN